MQSCNALGDTLSSDCKPWWRAEIADKYFFLPSARCGLEKKEISVPFTYLSSSLTFNRWQLIKRGKNRKKCKVTGVYFAVLFFSFPSCPARYQSLVLVLKSVRVSTFTFTFTFTFTHFTHELFLCTLRLALSLLSLVRENKQSLILSHIHQIMARQLSLFFFFFFFFLFFCLLLFPSPPALSINNSAVAH